MEYLLLIPVVLPIFAVLLAMFIGD